MWIKSYLGGCLVNVDTGFQILVDNDTNTVELVLPVLDKKTHTLDHITLEAFNSYSDAKGYYDKLAELLCVNTVQGYAVSFSGEFPAAKAKRVYAAEMSNGTVKIGISENVFKRLSTISTSSGLAIKQYAFSDFTAQAREIEQSLHELFKARRTKGEFFSITFNQACSALDEWIAIKKFRI